EVQDLHEVLSASAYGEQDVVAFEIAMHDAEVVGARESGAHLLEDVDAACERHRSASELCGERRFNQILYHQIELAVFPFADVVDVDNVRVIDAIRRSRLAQHPRTQVCLAAKIRADQFQRDEALYD